VTHFGRCRERLEATIGAACEAHECWPGKVGAAVHAALALAAADPDVGQTLTEASAHRRDFEDEFAELVDRLAGWLGQGAPRCDERLPDARTVVTRIARQVNLELEAGRTGSLMAIAPDLTFLALLPYLGFAEARRWSTPTATL
jgi:predicted trehalose synthase